MANTKDPILLNNIDNRDREDPIDILIPSKYNVVDDGRYTIRGNNSPFAMAGPANYAQSVIKTIQRAINEGRLEINASELLASNVTVTPSGNLTSTSVQNALTELQTDIDNIDGSETIITVSGLTLSGTGTSSDPYVIGLPTSLTTETFATILNDLDGSTVKTRVTVSYTGINTPTCTLSGTNDSQINIVQPANTLIKSINIYGRVEETTSQNSSGNRIISLSGAGVVGNTSAESLVLPNVQKADLSALDFDPLSSVNPAPLDLDSNPSVDIIGVGTTGSPSLTLRINSIGTFTKYNLKLKW